MTPEARISFDQIGRAFTGPIEPVRPTRWYRLALAAVVVSLILLQAIYLALVLAAAASTLGYILLLPTIFEALRINLITIVLILGPPVIGLITTFFLFKPIFARPLEPAAAPELTRDGQPELFAFVDALCNLLGSPRPQSIAVNLDANASAGLRRGLRSLAGNDLKLTIGLPLVETLTLAQFTGVLAHEFGHFSQKAGIRSWYLIQRIQHWFARVAYERDQWDERLSDWSANSRSWRVKLVLFLAHLTVAASRWLLRQLLRAAALVSSGFSRQMEYDADHYEASVVGAATFEATSMALPEIQEAAQRGWQQLDRAWLTRRLADNVPALVATHLERLPAEERDTIRRQTLEERTHRFATHPSTPERIANVRRRNAAGVFALDGPATDLFRDFPTLCRSVSLAHYRLSLGDAADRAELLAVEEFTGGVERQQELEEARQALFGGAEDAPRWFRLDTPETEPVPEDALPAGPTYRELLGRLLLQEGAVALLEAGARIEPEAFQISHADLRLALSEASQTRVQLDEVEQRHRAAFAGNVRRLHQAATFGPLPGGIEGHPGECRAAYRVLAELQPVLLELRITLVRRRVLEQNSRHLQAAASANALDSHARRLRDALEEIRRRLDPLPSPIVRPGAGKTVGRQLVPTLEGDPDALAAFALDEADAIGQALLDRLCWTALRIPGEATLAEEKAS